MDADKLVGGISTAILCSLAFASAARAAPSRLFDVARAPLPRALIDLARQAGVSLGGDIPSCGRGAVGLKGRYTVTGALERLLLEAPCGFVMLDPTTALIRRNPSLPSSTSAADSPIDPATSTVVVTATRRPEVLERSALSITALGHERLGAAGIHDLSDASVDVVGLTVTNLGPGRDKLLLRGLSDGVFTGSTQSSVALYLDDLPLTYNAPDPGLRLTDIDRVEIVRGPQGALYGGGAIGGVVRILPQRPSTEAFGGVVSVETSETQRGRSSGAAEAILNAPLLAGRGAIRLVGYSEIDGGYIDNAALGQKDINRTRRIGGRLSALLDLSPIWRLSLNGVGQTITSADGQYVTGNGGSLTRKSGLPEAYENDFSEVGLSLQGAMGWGTLKGSISLVRHRTDTHFDASDEALLFDPSAATGGGYDEHRRINLLVGELMARGHDIGRWRWTGGVFLARDEDQIATSVGEPIGATLFYREDRTDERLEVAGFGEVRYQISHRLELTAGARGVVSQISVKSSVSQPSLTLATRAYSGQLTYAGVAPKLALAFQYRRGTLLYVQVAQGYRPGGFNTGVPLGQAFDTPGVAGIQRVFAPDSAWTLEGGVKAGLFDRRVVVHLAAYATSWSNIQTDQFSAFRLPYTVNVGDGLIEGAELETAARLSDRWTLRVGGILADPQLTHERNPNFLSKGDAGLPGVPARSFNVGLSYRREMGWGVLTADAKFAYIGRSNLTFDAQIRSGMGGYSTGRLTAGMEVQRWRLAAFLDNPGDVRGNTFAFGNPFKFLEERQSTPLRPRTFGMSLVAIF